MQFKPFALLAAGAIAALLATACTKGSDQSSTTSTTTTTTTTSAPATSATASALGTAAAMGDAKHGKQIFTEYCASCHGATGTEGGAGPSLKNEKSKKNDAATVAWIKDPKTTLMPKLYPSPLAEKDVEDVAAYVQTL